jgi:hypothetical protein
LKTGFYAFNPSFMNSYPQSLIFLYKALIFNKLELLSDLIKPKLMIILKQLSICLLIAVAAIQLGCKKGAQGETGPAGPADLNTGLTTNGSYIKGTVTTTTAASDPVSFSFNHSYMASDIAYGGDLNTTTASLGKDFKGIMNSDYSTINIDLDSISDTAPSLFYIEIYAEPTIGPDSLFSFYMDGVPTVTNYQYNSATHTMSGDYTMTNTNTNNGNSATVTGSFKLVGVIEPVQ